MVTEQSNVNARMYAPGVPQLMTAPMTNKTALRPQNAQLVVKTTTCAQGIALNSKKSQHCCPEDIRILAARKTTLVLKSATTTGKTYAALN